MRYRFDGPSGIPQPNVVNKVTADEIHALQRMLADHGMNFQTLARQMEAHVGVATHFLRRINSVSFGAGRKITSLSHALVLMGTSAIERELNGMIDLLEVNSTANMTETLDSRTS